MIFFIKKPFKKPYWDFYNNLHFVRNEVGLILILVSMILLINGRENIGK